MQGQHLLFPIYIPGTLTGNHLIQFTAPFDMTLVKVSSICGNTTSFILDIGTAADDDAYLDGVTVTGVTDVPVEHGKADFVNAEFPRIAKGTVVDFAIDYDGGAGGDSSNVVIVATFLEG